MVEIIDNHFIQGITGKEEEFETSKLHIRLLTGRLLHLSTHTRPDISFPMGALTLVLWRFIWHTLEHCKAISPLFSRDFNTGNYDW